MCLRGSGVWGGVVLDLVLGYCRVFFPFVCFLVHGSGLSTSFYVTSLYIDAALLGGARHTLLCMWAA